MRTGHQIKHNLYDNDDNCIGHTHTDEQAAEIVATYEARQRTIERLDEYIAVGGMVNPKQIKGLLSLTWPDGNYCSS